MNINDIAMVAFNDPVINKYMNKYIKGTDKAEFKQHFYLILLQKDLEWLLVRMVSIEYFRKSCISIINNQYKDKESAYWKNNLFNREIGSRPTKKSFEEDSCNIEEDEYTKLKHEVVNEEFQYDYNIDYLTKYDDGNIINHLRADHYIQYKLHIEYGMSLREISKETGVNYQTIRRNIIKVINTIKEKLPPKIKKLYE